MYHILNGSALANGCFVRIAKLNQFRICQFLEASAQVFQARHLLMQRAELRISVDCLFVQMSYLTGVCVCTLLELTYLQRPAIVSR